MTDLIASPLIIGASLVGIGFFTGLSGAMIPGPMLAYVVSDTLKKGALSGPLTMIGHIFVELTLIATLVLGIGFTSFFLQFKALIYVTGGIALIVMSVLGLREVKQAKSKDGGEKITSKMRVRGVKYALNSSILGGILYTAFNPAFIPWWVTIGYPLLLQGFEWFAMAGIVFVSIGHFLSDLTWYSFISYSFSKSSNFFVGKRYEVTLRVLALFVIALGVVFVFKGAAGLL